MKTYVANANDRERNWLVVDATGQTLGRLLTFVLAALIYSAIAGTIITALVGPDGFVADLLRNILTLPVTFASVG